MDDSMKFLIIMIIIACVVRVLVPLFKPTVKGKSGEVMVGMLLKGLPSDQYIVIRKQIITEPNKHHFITLTILTKMNKMVKAMPVPTTYKQIY